MTSALSLRPPFSLVRRLRFHGAKDFLSHFLVLLLLSGLCACSKEVTLQSGLKDADANEMLTVLNRHGIGAHKTSTKEGVSLMVNDEDISRATEALNAAGLPRRNLSNLGQVFKKEGMISTPLEERVRYIHGLSDELEYTLQQFDHVIEARVHVVLPERVAPGEPIQPSSAAVFIKYTPPLDEDTVIPRVRSLVASSIPGLSGEDGRNKVSVVLMAGEPPAAEPDWTMVGPFRVAGESAGALVNVFAGLVLALVLAIAAIVVLVLWHHPKTSAWMKQRFSRIPVFSAGNVAG
jgi:type III secretion protein J